MARNIYVASSWRNPYQPAVVGALRSLGHQAYDFRNPPHSPGFRWEQITQKDVVEWTVADYFAALDHPRAKAGFAADFAAMHRADTFVLVQPCGRSAHLELGWAVGQGKTTIVVFPESTLDEPELMVKMCDHLVVGMDALLDIMEAEDKVAAMAEFTEMEKALNYYKSASLGKRPDFVPGRVLVSATVRGCGPYHATHAAPGEYACESNQWGAISVQASNGILLGLKPGEFQVLTWKEREIS